jgi:succinate dehydrogenase / fumarate reductase flavoprotein subunit
VCAVTAGAEELRGQAVHVRLHPLGVQGQYAETEEEADQWLKDNDSARRTPDLLPRDEVARAINSEVKAAAAAHTVGVPRHRHPHDAGGDQTRLPSMYHQFLELAEVDITKDEMEVGRPVTT